RIMRQQILKLFCLTQEPINLLIFGLWLYFGNHKPTCFTQTFFLNEVPNLRKPQLIYRILRIYHSFDLCFISFNRILRCTSFASILLSIISSRNGVTERLESMTVSSCSEPLFSPSSLTSAESTSLGMGLVSS